MFPDKKHLIPSLSKTPFKRLVPLSALHLAICPIWEALFASMPIASVDLDDRVANNKINNESADKLLPLVLNLVCIKKRGKSIFYARPFCSVCESGHHAFDIFWFCFLVGIPFMPTLCAAKFCFAVTQAALICLEWFTALLASNCLRGSNRSSQLLASASCSTLWRAVIEFVNSRWKPVMALPAKIAADQYLGGFTHWLWAGLKVFPFGSIKFRLGFVRALFRATKPPMNFALAALEWLAANLARPCFPSRPGVDFKASLRAIFAFAIGGIRIGHHKLLAAIQTSLERIACGAAAFSRAKSKPLLLGWWDLNGLAAVLALHVLHVADYIRRLFYCVQWEGKQ